MFRGWEGNRRSGVALAMRHRLSGLSTQRPKKGEWAPHLHPSGIWHLYLTFPGNAHTYNNNGTESLTLTQKTNMEHKT